MKKKILSIALSVVVLVALIAVLVPGCTEEGGGDKGTIEVKATLCGEDWQGLVNYKLTPASGSAVSGTQVPASFNVTTGTWTCEDVSGGPAGAYLKSIKPSATQSLTKDGKITFTLEFELDQDAWIDFLAWTIDGQIWQGGEYYYEAVPCNIIDVHFQQGVLGCEGRIVAVNETSRLWIHYMGWTDQYMGQPVPPMPGQEVYLNVVNDLCAVNKTAEPPANPPEKVSQKTTYGGEYVDKGTILPLPWCENTELDVETIWQLVKETDYVKSINWFGISFDPEMHECVLYDLLLPWPPIPGWYVFQLVAEAEVALVDDVDVNSNNDKATSPPLTIWVWGGP